MRLNAERVLCKICIVPTPNALELNINDKEEEKLSSNTTMKMGLMWLVQMKIVPSLTTRNTYNSQYPYTGWNIGIKVTDVMSNMHKTKPRGHFISSDMV